MKTLLLECFVSRPTFIRGDAFLWPPQEILAGWLLRDVARARLEPALRQLQHDDESPASETAEAHTITHTIVDALLRWASLDVRALHYEVKSDLAA